MGVGNGSAAGAAVISKVLEEGKPAGAASLAMMSSGIGSESAGGAAMISKALGEGKPGAGGAKRTSSSCTSAIKSIYVHVYVRMDIFMYACMYALDAQRPGG